MTELKPIQGLFAVEVPGKASLFELNNWSELFLLPHPGHSVRKKWAIFPPASYEILFTTSNVTEQQAAEILKIETYSGSAKDTLNHVLENNGLHPDKQNYLLIKKK